jgi:acyl-CoA hydrolase
MDLSKGTATAVHLVMPNDTNPQGNLFGGKGLEWMDIAAGLAAMRLSRRTVATASIERVDFKVPIHRGEMAVVKARVAMVGRTSMKVRVDMFRENPKSGDRQLCTEGIFNMVALDENGKPTPVFPEA